MRALRSPAPEPLATVAEVGDIQNPGIEASSVEGTLTPASTLA